MLRYGIGGIAKRAENSIAPFPHLLELGNKR
jgi:hypothetical protein